MNAAAVGLRLGLGLVASLVVSAAAVAPAAAEFGPIELVSKSAAEQGSRDMSTAISADGRYVAFDGQLGGREGVFRKDLQTGAVAFVAPGRVLEPVLEPSISGDGRYIAFTTAAPLLAADDPEPASKDVYVADMATAPPSYELASAADGSWQSIGGQSRATGHGALSADGREVVFTNNSQVYVRALGTEKTILITGRRDPLTGTTTTEPVPDGGVFEQGREAGATISADGSTVAWVGWHLPEQVPMLADEAARVRHRESTAVYGSAVENGYFEPLWRRVPTAVDPDPGIRRVVGGGDPLAPGCPAGGTLADPACQGPYPDVSKGREYEMSVNNSGFGWGIKAPRLSADGNTVALVGDPDELYDLFVVDMAPGLSRDEAVRQLTHWVNPLPDTNNPSSLFNNPSYLPYFGQIEGLALSSDGKRIAFTTARQFFAPSPPSLITPPPPGTSQAAELYQLSLEGETIERATPDGDQAVSDGPASGPSYSGDGLVLAFSSTASNLVAGDANESGDAFVVRSSPQAPTESSVVSPRPPELVLEPRWHLSASAVSLPNGNVRLLLGVPGAGTARARATAPLGARLRPRPVANSQHGAAAAGVLRLDLRLNKGRRRLARRNDGLYARVRISFTGKGGGPLHAELEARFRAHRERTTQRDRGGR